MNRSKYSNISNVETFQIKFGDTACICMANLYFRLLMISSGLYSIASLHTIIWIQILLQGSVLTVKYTSQTWPRALEHNLTSLDWAKVSLFSLSFLLFGYDDMDMSFLWEWNYIRFGFRLGMEVGNPDYLTRVSVSYG